MNLRIFDQINAEAIEEFPLFAVGKERMPNLLDTSVRSGSRETEDFLDSAVGKERKFSPH